LQGICFVLSGSISRRGLHRLDRTSDIGHFEMRIRVDRRTDRGVTKRLLSARGVAGRS